MDNAMSSLKRAHNTRAVAHVVIVEGKSINRPLLSGANVYCRLKLGACRPKETKSVREYENPVWNESFEFYLNEGAPESLEITIRNRAPGFARNEILGEVNVDFLKFQTNVKEDIWLDLKGNNNGRLRLNVTLSGVKLKELSSNEDNLEKWKFLRRVLEKRKLLSDCFFSPKHIGHLVVCVYGAEGLSPTHLGARLPNPVCQVKLRDNVVRTQIITRSLSPCWNSYFEFDIMDMTDYIEFTILDERNIGPDRNRTIVGCIQIPLLQISGYKKLLYSLNDNATDGQAPRLLLEFIITYSSSMSTFLYTINLYNFKSVSLIFGILL